MAKDWTHGLAPSGIDARPWAVRCRRNLRRVCYPQMEAFVNRTRAGSSSACMGATSLLEAISLSLPIRLMRRLLLQVPCLGIPHLTPT